MDRVADRLRAQRAVDEGVGDPARPAIDRIVRAVGRTVQRYRAEARRIAAAIAYFLIWRQDGADIEERPRRTPVGEVVAKRERTDRRAGDVVSAFAVLGIGET